jgi:hypothetical protein
VVVAPLQVACAGSPAVAPLRRWLDPYISALFLDHGYFFFAPDPGPSALVDYKVELADSRAPIEGRFPNLKEQQPRLLYHRYFMLSEALYARFAPPEPPPAPPSPPLTASEQERRLHEINLAEHARQVEEWKRRRQVYEAMRTSIEQHLLAEYGGERVTITQVQHRPPMPDEVSVLRKPLDAPEFYRNLSENPTRGQR